MKSIEFYVNKFKYIDGIENADISFISALQKRRLSSLDKITFSALNNCFDTNVQNIIFSSPKGEIDRLLTIIEQYTNENVSSPIVFSASVHNYAVSAFLLNKNFSIPYNCISAGEESFCAGLLAAITSKYDNNLFVYSDVQNDKYISLCINISKNKKEGALKFAVMNSVKQSDYTLNDFIGLFNGNKKHIETPLFIIERISND